MVDALSAYLREAAADGFDARGRNCMLWVAEWVRLRAGVDPAATWRGFDQVDVLAVAASAMAGFPEVAVASRGDVGVVLAPRPTAAICTGRRWAALAPQGLAAASWPVLRAWGLPHA